MGSWPSQHPCDAVPAFSSMAGGHTWRFMGSYNWAISRVTILIIQIRGLIASLVTAHEPPSREYRSRARYQKDSRARQDCEFARASWTRSAAKADIYG